MPSVSKWIANIGPAGLVVQAIFFSAAGIALLLAFILIRRAIRRRHFRLRDMRVLEIRDIWDGILNETVSRARWRYDRLGREIVETILLDKLEVAQGEEAAILLRFLRDSGLLDKRIYECRNFKGWRRRRALTSLGRMRSPESIPALAEALDDGNPENVMAAVRGLGRLGIPDAAIPLLDRLVSGKLVLPSIPVQNALLNCCKWKPQILVPYLRRAGPETRALLARALGEVATGDLGEDLLLLAADAQAEVRASAARSLGQARLDVALSALGSLSEDPEWFVRLRAVVGLGQLRHPRTIPLLIPALCDRNRFVRLRAAMGLARLADHLESIFDQVKEKRDPYAQQALLSELERSGAILRLVDALAGEQHRRAAAVLRRALEFGAHRLLVSTVRSHQEWRVRVRVARLLAGSGIAQIVPLLEAACQAECAQRSRKILGWALAQLRKSGAAGPRQEMVPAG